MSSRSAHILLATMKISPSAELSIAADLDTAATAVQQYRCVLIKLSQRRDQWLHVHHAILSAASPVLRTSLSNVWAATSKLDTIVHSVTSEMARVRTLALKKVEGTIS